VTNARDGAPSSSAISPVKLAALIVASPKCWCFGHSMRRARHYPLDTKKVLKGESISARIAPAGFQLLPVAGNNHFP
jgi:hypothetical protein